MPTNATFLAHMLSLGIRRSDLIVCYDQGPPTAARAWYTFLAFGAPCVKVLDGGLSAWKSHGFPVAQGCDKFASAPEDGMNFARNDNFLADLRFMNETVPKVLSNQVEHYILDARSSERFLGAVDEPMPGIRLGCISGAINVPYSEILQPGQDGNTRMLSVEELKEYFDSKGIDLRKPITVYSGTGLTACAVLLALYRLGARQLRLYDGSWSEYV